jgi:hypothetical protein
MTESSYDRKLFPKNGNLTERSFDRMLSFEKWSFDRFFRKIVILPNKFLTKGKTLLESKNLFSFLNLHPTRIEIDCTDVFVAASRRADENIKFS